MPYAAKDAKKAIIFFFLKVDLYTLGPIRILKKIKITKHQ